MSSPTQKILVALSGGVDSAVAALRLKEAGHDVAGAYMRTWMDESGSGILAACPWEEDIRHARAVARHLGIDFEVVNLIDQYREHVVQYLVEGYRHGQTPNPDIMCNRQMKFGVLASYAAGQGFDAVATGHYARREALPHDACIIRQGRDPDKDQSYFLAMVRRDAFRRVHFPIGDLQKTHVRQVAEDAGLPNASRKDSQGICFLGKVRITDFLAQYIGDQPGAIVHSETGRQLGTHKGLHRYTIGQRKGIGIPSNADFEKYVVVDKDMETNSLHVAFESPEAPGLHADEASVRGFNWLADPLPPQAEVQARVRYRDPPVPVRLEFGDNGSARVSFSQTQRALAPGQVLALYDGDRLLGGAWFS